MAQQKTVWIVGNPTDLLDARLFQIIKTRFGKKVNLLRRDRVREDKEGVAERLLRTVLSDEGERKSWVEELKSTTSPPDVVVTSSSDDICILAELARRGGPRPVRLGISREPEAKSVWHRIPFDILTVFDSYSSQSMGEEQGQVRVTGVPVEEVFQIQDDPPHRREAESLNPDAHVLVITANAFDQKELGQLMVQLAMVRIELEILFEVDNPQIADNLRRMAPVHGIAASLFPSGDGGASFWGLAHLVIGRADSRDFALSRVVGVPLLVAPPRGTVEKHFAAGLVASGSGRSAESIATLAVDLDLTLEPERYEALVERVRELRVENSVELIVETVSDALKGREKLLPTSVGIPQSLERISRGKPREERIAPERFDDAAQAATVVRDRKEVWRQRARIARSHGDEELAVEADKRAARHREVLDRLLDNLRPSDWADRRDECELEEELEALRRRNLPDANMEQRLRSLEVEDELRALKERLERE